MRCQMINLFVTIKWVQMQGPGDSQSSVSWHHCSCPVLCDFSEISKVDRHSWFLSLLIQFAVNKDKNKDVSLRRDFQGPGKTPKNSCK